MAISTLSPLERVRQASGWSIAWGVGLIIFGMLAIAAPGVAAIAVNIFIAWMIVFAGVVHVVLAFYADRARTMIWRGLVGLAYVAFGVYLLTHPLIGVASLTLLLATLFLVEGVLDIMMWWKMRGTEGASWVLIDGIVTLLLGGLIYVQWPSSSLWAIGTLVGVSMIMSGIARVMLSLAVRRASKHLGELSFPRAA